MPRIRIIGIEKKKPKEDNSHKYSGVEGEVEVSEPSELGEALKDLNDDTIDPDTKMSKIDMNSRLHSAEIGAIIAVDCLIGMNVWPSKTIRVPTQKKRLAVSLNGLGRKEKVELAVGQREHGAMTSGGITDRIRGMIGGRQ